jgi:Fe-S-cluster containining protein
MSKKKIKQTFSQINFLDSFDKLRTVHKSIPNFDFDCKNCKNNCCVSPYISIIEFIYVVRYILKNFKRSNEILNRDNGRNNDGILMCPFLNNEKQCLIYPVRHYKCRMTGMDILDDIFLDGCDHKREIGLKSPKITKEEWYKWIEILTKANRNFKYDDQKTFQSWISFYFEFEYRLNDNEKRVRKILKNYLHIEEYIPHININDF